MELNIITEIAKRFPSGMNRITYSNIIEDTDPLCSKVLGIPYWEANHPYPLGPRKQPLCFLAQINFSEMHDLSPIFPKTGLLQFFICSENWGLDYDKPYLSNRYFVKYWEDPQLYKYVSTYNNLSWEAPAVDALKINFGDFELDYCGGSDEYYFDKIYGDFLGNNIETDNMDYALSEILFDLYDNSGSKVGGYAYFTQSDPRIDNPEHNELLGLLPDADPEWVLLFQMDSDHDDLMWGDSGVANWFITKQDLQERRFDRILFNWDCC